MKVYMGVRIGERSRLKVKNKQNLVFAFNHKKFFKGESIMKGITTEQGRNTLERFKVEAANEVGVNLKNGYNGDLTSREAGSVGGQMVKKMIDSYKTGSAK